MIGDMVINRQKVSVRSQRDRRSDGGAENRYGQGDGPAPHLTRGQPHNRAEATGNTTSTIERTMWARSGEKMTCRTQGTGTDMNGSARGDTADLKFLWRYASGFFGRTCGLDNLTDRSHLSSTTV